MRYKIYNSLIVLYGEKFEANKPLVANGLPNENSVIKPLKLIYF
jgi:hypothetical protein